MGRATLILNDAGNKQLAAKWVRMAPAGTRVEFKRSKRTLPQNDHMWSLLTEVSQQATHMGRKYDTNSWKCIFLHALGREIEFLPSLDGKEIIPYGNSSSDLSKQEMSDLIDLIYAWGATHDIKFTGAVPNSSQDAPAQASGGASSPSSLAPSGETNG